MTLSAKNAQDGNADVWTYTFEHLPDTDGSGNPYTYWVEEEHLESYTVTGSGTLALTNTPVSYTHLDVYKRQPMCPPPMGCWPIWGGGICS